PGGRYAGGDVGLSVAAAVAPPRHEASAARVEFLDAVVIFIRDVDVPAPVRCHGVGIVELSVAVAEAPPLGDEGAAVVEPLDAFVIRDVNVVKPIARHA